MARETQPSGGRTRDKEAKIASILDATLRLIEEKGYEGVTSRDIAQEAGVSNGLVFRYFPGGKPGIVKALSLRFASDTLKLYRYDEADFDDFPGFLRTVLCRVISYNQEHYQILAAITIVLLADKKITLSSEDEINFDLAPLVDFYGQFKGIDTSRLENPGEFVTQWLEILNAVIIHHMAYLSAFGTDEKLIDALVNLSLRLWGYERSQ